MGKVSRIRFYEGYREVLDGLVSQSLVEDKRSRAVYEDSENGARLLFEGSGFTYDEAGLLKGGIVSDFFLVAEDGERLQRISAADIRIRNVTFENPLSIYNWLFGKVYDTDNKYFGSRGPDGLNAGMGKDQVWGSAGDDSLAFSLGNDRLIGGGGSDDFIIELYSRRGTVVDFDADGSDGTQDHIVTRFFEFADIEELGDIRRSGRHDTVIEMASHWFKLLDVRPSELDETDFIYDPN
jgi:Ca2+-binding RTX toxin-like protein